MTEKLVRADRISLYEREMFNLPPVRFFDKLRMSGEKVSQSPVPNDSQ